MAAMVRCPLCEKVTQFVSTESPTGLWVCSSCPCRITDEKFIQIKKQKNMKMPLTAEQRKLKQELFQRMVKEEI